MEREYKYYVTDFGKLPVKVLHMDLDFDVYDTETKVDSKLRLEALEELNTLSLDAKNLDILSVECDFCKIDFDYKKEDNKVIINFHKKVPMGRIFTISTKNIFKPTKNILEGMYYDESPKGAPPTMITQCQQWGFQRLVPCFDDMTAKCTYTTTIAADCRYTNLITNGDVIEKRKNAGKGRDRIKYQNNIPMPPYLFFLGVGTYRTFTKEFEYPNGDKFNLELLVMPEADAVAAERALEVLYDSVLWIYLFTGPDRYKNEEVSRKLWILSKERDHKKRLGEDLKEIRKKLSEFSKGRIFGYKYTLQAYREIAMQNSDFGGMENLGNTTITANRIMPYKEMPDGGFEYMIAVKVHEFYHNLNGSQVTGWSPFELWLNEAVTVHIERQFEAFILGNDYQRLKEVLGLLSPDHGTFQLDEGTMSMPILPDGFNDPNELITAITYVKAAEFVKMIETYIGKETFEKGLNLYFTKFKDSNATTDQWIGCMEAASDISLKEMAKVWLKKTGYPVVEAKTDYDSRKQMFSITLNQTNCGDMPWIFPLKLAILDEKGNLIEEKVERITKKTCRIEFKEQKAKPAIISFNRDHSFYGKIRYEQDYNDLYNQLIYGDDTINRYIAYFKIADQEKTRLLEDKDAKVSDQFTDLYFRLLSDKKLTEKLGSLMLPIMESVEAKEYAHRYQDLYNTRKKILKRIAERFKDKLISIYFENKKPIEGKDYLEKEVASIKRRQVKNLCLVVLSNLDTEDIHEMMIDQFKSATAATDKIIAFQLILNSSAKEKLKILDEYESIAKRKNVSWETFLYSVGGNDCEECIDLIKRVERSDAFRIEQANDQRSLYESFASNKKKSLQTELGRAFLKEKIIMLTPINEHTVVRILGIFGHVDKMEEKYHFPILQMLVGILEKIDKVKTPSVYNNIKRILLSMDATKRYEKKNGEIKVLSS